MGEIILKTKDQLKLEIVCKTALGEIDREEAAKVLSVSNRTLRRYLKNYSDRGISFLLHGNKNKIPYNKTNDAFKKKIQNLIQEKYFDFNVCHLKEILFEETGVEINYSKLYRWCKEINLIKNQHRKRRSKPRKHRQRMTSEGYMIQLDGSHHQWFGDRFLCLMAAVDDATGEVFAKFYEGETTFACLDFLKDLVLKKGVPKFVYTDRAGVYGGIKRNHFSQVERALGELGSHVIYASSPEGKGRVERLFRTLQDRLVAELRLNGIINIYEANLFLEKKYLPHKHNPSFMVKAENPVSSYKSLPPAVSLDQVFIVKEQRVIAKDHTVSIRGERWMISAVLGYSMKGMKLELQFDQWGDWEAYFAGRKLKLVKVKRAQKITA